MEMDESLQQQLLMTQSQMMEQMRQMQQTQVSMTETMRQDNVKKESLYQREMQSKNVNVDTPEDKMIENAFGKKSAFQPIAAAADDVLTSRNHLLGAEAVQHKHSDTRQKVQMGAMNAVGGAAETAASVGSFFVPGGLIASTALGIGVGSAVSYGTKQMINGAKDALNYQSILEEKGYKAFNVFEGHNDFGGIGMTLNQQQDMSSYLRDLEPEKLLNSDEISKILSGALDGKLLKSATDLKSFKKKFSEIVDTVKEVSVVMNTSLEEATKMMGELESRGIGGGKATMLAAQAKVNASIMGVDSKQAFANNLAASSELSVGSGIDQEKTMGINGSVTYVTTQLMDQYKNDDAKNPLYHYIKNNGGEQVIANRGTDVILNELGRNENTRGLVPALIGYAADYDENGRLVFDKDKIKQATDQQLDAQTLMKMSSDNLNRFSAGEVEQFVNHAPEEIKQSLSTNEMAGVWRALIDQQSMGGQRKGSEVLLSLGVAKDATEAQILMDQINETDEAAVGEFTGLSTREALTSIKRVNSPGMVQQAKGWWKGTVTNPLGDIGQAVTDEIGDIGLDVQKAINNVDSKQGIQSNYLLKGEAFSDRAEFDKKMYSGDESFKEAYNKNIEIIMNTPKKEKMDKDYEVDKPKAGYTDFNAATTSVTEEKKKELNDTVDEYLMDGKGDSTRTLTQGQYQVMLNRANKGNLSLTEVAKLRDDLDEGIYQTKDEKSRVNDIIDVASGEKKIEDIDLDRLTEGLDEDAKKATDAGRGKLTVKDVKKDLTGKVKKYMKAKTKAQKNALQSAMKLELSSEEAGALERAIRSGKTEEVEKLTDDKKVLEYVGKMDAAQKKIDTGTAASDAMAGMIDNTAAKTDVAQYTVDMMVSSKAMTKENAQVLFADVIEQRKAIDKGLKGDWSLDRIQEETKVLDDMVDGKMNALSDKEAAKFAEGLSSLNGSDQYDKTFFQSDNGDGIDREKLTKAMEAIVVAGATKKGNAVNAGDADKAFDDHKDAMGKMLKTVSEETAMMKKATKNIKNGTPFQYSSITGK